MKARLNNENIQTYELVKLISDSVSLTIEAVSGEEIILDANDIFAEYNLDYDIGFEFLEFGAVERGRVTSKTIVQVYKIQQFLTLTEVFSCFNREIEDLCLTQHQILAFIRDYRQWVTGTTLFPFISNGNTFVVVIWPDEPDSRTFIARVRPLKNNDAVWSGYDNLVIPIIES